MLREQDIEAMLSQYVETALWSTNDESTPEGGVPLDDNHTPDDVDANTLKRMREDCERFARENLSTIQAALAKRQRRGGHLLDWGSVGHDFWLNRNGHGCGFWDGDWPEPEATALDKAAKDFGEVWLYVGDDGRIHGHE